VLSKNCSSAAASSAVVVRLYVRNDGGATGRVAICSAESAAESVAVLSATYLHGSEIFIDLHCACSTNIWRCWEANVLGHARQDRDLEIVRCLLPYLVGSLLWKLHHVLGVVGTQRPSSSLQFKHPLIALFEDLFAHMANRLEVLAVHLVTLCCGYDFKILLLVLEQFRLVSDLLGASVVYALSAMY
jgi:hypothetical protein